MIVMATIKKTRVVDKWKTKQWYTVLAPSVFENKEIAEVVSSEEKNLRNRIILLTLAEVTGQHSQTSMFTTLKFRIMDIKGKTAYTQLIGHEIAQAYIKTLSRRNRSLINIVYDMKTKDEQIVRIKILAITGSELSQNTKKNIYHAIMDVLNKSQNYSTDHLMQEIIFGKFAIKLFNRLKQITLMRRVEIKKSELKEVVV